MTHCTVAGLKYTHSQGLLYTGLYLIPVQTYILSHNYIHTLRSLSSVCCSCIQDLFFLHFYIIEYLPLDDLFFYYTVFHIKLVGETFKILTNLRNCDSFSCIC